MSGGLVKQLTQGLKDGLAVTAGIGVTNFAASKVPFGQGSVVGRALTQLGLGLAGAMVVRKVTKSDRAAAFYAAGAFSNVIRPLLAPLPVIGVAFAGVGTYVQAPRRMGTYVQPMRLNGWAAAPQGGALNAGNGDDMPVNDDSSMMMA
jgi:hypothetical protein